MTSNVSADVQSPTFDPHVFLRELRKQWAHLPPQGSKQWRLERERTAGGSDAAVISRVSTFKSPASLIASRIGIGAKFAGNTATYWGNFTEPITRAWCADHFKCEIIELGTLPGPIPGQTFSGDGFGVVRTPWRTADGHAFTLDELVIFEFKSMTSRKHKFEAGELLVPLYYMPQLQVGLMTVPQAAYSIYAETTIRRCAVHMLDMSEDGACADFGPQELPPIMGLGLVGVRWRGRAPQPVKKEQLTAAEASERINALMDAGSADESPWYQPLLSLWEEREASRVLPDGCETLRYEGPPLLDLARMPVNKFNLIPQAILDDQHEHGLVAVYQETPDEPPHVTFQRLLDECRATDSDVFGVVGVKVFTLHTRLVERMPEFRENYEPQVRKFLEVLHWAQDQPRRPTLSEIQDALL